jgi:hypothetical protein
MSSTPGFSNLPDGKADLRDLLFLIDSVDVSNAGTFQEVLDRSLNILVMTDQQFGDALLVSRATVNRWRHGDSAPHVAMRQPILKWIRREVSRRLRMMEARSFLRPVIGTTSGSYPASGSYPMQGKKTK